MILNPSTSVAMIFITPNDRQRGSVLALLIVIADDLENRSMMSLVNGLVIESTLLNNLVLD